MAKAKNTDLCSYCGKDATNEDRYEWDEGQPYCSEACFEAAQESELS